MAVQHIVSGWHVNTVMTLLDLKWCEKCIDCNTDSHINILVFTNMSIRLLVVQVSV